MATPLVTRLAAVVAAAAALALLCGCTIGIPGFTPAPAHPTPTETVLEGGDSSSSPASSAPSASPSGSPSDEFADPDPTSLYGTTWSGTESTGDPLIVAFAADGSFTYTNTGVPDDPAHAETWKLVGMKITLSFNDGFAVDEGLLDDDTMNGTGSNVKGESWTWTMTKVT